MTRVASTDKGLALVTGATGFIGNRLVAALLGDGYRVRALVRDPGRGRGLGDVELHVGDLTDESSLAGIERGVDSVIHGASLLGKWGTDPRRMAAVNVRGSLALLERFRGSAVSRYVHLSAGGVSGPVRVGSVDETYACRPATPYERTKYEAERKVLELAPRLEVPALVVRPTFTYGPGDPHKVALFGAVL